MNSNEPIMLANKRMLEFIATKLGDLCEEVVFLGGCTTGLFITDPEFPDVRYTTDVDCITDVINLSQYYQFEKKLIKKGFKRSLTESVICRWFYDDAVLDVMPIEESVLGFGNRWYKKAINKSVNYFLTDTISIRMLTAPYFLATKLEAFKTCGHLVQYGSLAEGRAELLEQKVKLIIKK